jgi:hypothetical protein
MTLPLTIVLLALWSVAMIRYGRSVLFPPASLAIVWTITLLAIWLCGDIYYPLTNSANQIVLAGVLAFSLGGSCALAAPFRMRRILAAVRARRRMQVDRWLTVAGILLLLNIHNSAPPSRPGKACGSKSESRPVKPTYPVRGPFPLSHSFCLS